MIKHLSKCIILSVLLLAITGNSAKAQKNSLKVYGNFLILNSEKEPWHFNHTPSPFSYRGISVAYQLINKEGRIHEWEIRISFDKENTDSLKFNQFNAHVRYEIGRRFKRKLSKKIDFGISGGGKIFYLHETVNRQPGFEFQRINNAVGINIAALAHLEYALSKNIYIDLSLTLGGASIDSSYQYYDNPALTERQKKQGGFDLDLFRERLLRIGVGYRFGPEDSE